MKIDAIKLHTGWFARPEGAAGTIGWHPFPWTGAMGKTKEKAIANFKQVNERQLAEYERVRLASETYVVVCKECGWTCQFEIAEACHDVPCSECGLRELEAYDD